MNEVELLEIINNDITIVEKRLIELLPDAKFGQEKVVEAMKYSLSNGGKRIRPVLCMEFAQACGASRYDAVDLACALEFVHTYSLIHDDLPCMDDDDYRRGQLSCHKKFGEATALLAGDALLTTAFQIIGQSTLSDKQIVDAICLLSSNSGVQGMIGGQVIDLIFESHKPNINQLLTVHKLKTGALISAACLMGCIVGNASDEDFIKASKYAYNLGIAFQIKDDILDVTSSFEELGKPVGSDINNNKTTYVDLKGLDQAQKDVETLTNNAISNVKNFDNFDFLEAIALYLVNRKK